jgi:hypothetical protein
MLCKIWGFQSGESEESIVVNWVRSTWIQSNLRNIVFKMKDRTMDNDKSYDSDITFSRLITPYGGI